MPIVDNTYVSLENVGGEQVKTLRTQIMLGFGIVLALVIALGVNSIVGINGFVKHANNVSDEQFPILVTDARLSNNIIERIALVRGYMLTNDEHYMDQFDQLTESSIELQEQLLEMSNNETTRIVVDQSVELRKLIKDTLIPLIQDGRMKEATKLLRDEVEPTSEILVANMAEMSEAHQEDVLHMGEQRAKEGRYTALYNFILAIASVIVGGVVSIYLSRNISRPVVEVTERIGRMSEGIFNDPPLKTKRKDEIGDQVRSLNTMREKIQHTLIGTLHNADQLNEHSQELITVTGSVNDAANQIAATMEELAAGSESQAHTASNMAEMVGEFFEDVQQVHQAGTKVSGATRTVLQRTEDGDRLMNESVEQMNEIYRVVNDSVSQIRQLDDQTKEISSLVTVISEIAEQTNLLALNAAIEAARAGEQGKGFAVVADEVRKLAEQVASSVNEITTIVNRVQVGSSKAVTALETGYESVTDGKEKVLTTGEVFNEISELVLNMVTLTDDMSSNLDHIEKIGEQMTSGVSEVASIAEQSAAGVQQTTASVEQTSFQVEKINEGAIELAQLAEELTGSVHQFEIESNEEKA